MKKSTKAALISCFVFPGLGHFYLKRYVPGLFLSGGAAVAAYFIVSSAVQTASAVLDKIQNEGVLLDVEAITAMVSQQSLASANSSNIAMIALTTFWLIGILDSFRVGRKLA